MKKVESALWKVLDWFLFLGTTVMVLLVFFNVIGRYVFNYSFASFEEIARLLFVWGTYIGAAVAIRDGTHIRVDILVNALKPEARKVVDIIANLLMDFIMIITIRAMMSLIKINIANPLPITRISYGVVQGIIPLCLTIMLIINVIRLVQMFRKRPEKTEGEVKA